MTDRLHLQTRHREILEWLFREHLPAVEVWAYGSRVNGRSHDGSDLDLVLRGPSLEEIPAGQLADLEDAVRDSTIPFLVEARDWARLPEQFHREIERDYTVLFDATTGGDEVGWQRCRLADITDNFDAIRVPVKRADRRYGPYPYYGASGIVDYVDSYLFDGEYVLVAEDGENLRTRKTPIAFLADGKFWVNNHAHILRGNGKGDTRYIMYAFSVLDISGYLTGSTIPKLTKGNLERIALRLPPIPEQRAIAHILGTLDDKIELNGRMNETLEVMAQAIFKDWFVDFGPTRAKAEGGAPYLAPELWDLFPDTFDDEGKPAGWFHWTIADLATHHRQTVSPSVESTRLFEHYSIPAYDAGKEPALDVGSSIKSNKTVVPRDAVLLSKLNPNIPRTWIPYPPNGRPQIASTEFLVFTAVSPATPGLLYCLFQDAKFRREMEAMVTGTSKSHQRVAPKALVQREVLTGATDVFGLFDEQTSALLSRVVGNRAESRTLAETRDMLLPKLVSGEIRLPDAEEAVEAVT